MSLPCAHGGPASTGVLKASPADFQVFEHMHVRPEGEGEHLWLEIEKTGWNTEDVALLLAKQAGVHRLAVGYSGLKDKHAITRQWFSLHLPGKADAEFDWPPGLRMIQGLRHRRKLNRGTHRANGFVLRVTDFQGDRQQLEQQLATIERRARKRCEVCGCLRCAATCSTRCLPSVLTGTAGTGYWPVIYYSRKAAAACSLRTKTQRPAKE